MIHKIHLFKLIALLLIAYFIYSRVQINKDDYFGLLVIILLAVLVVLAGKHAWQSNKERFTIPRIEIDASRSDFIRNDYWAQINDEIMWTNYGKENVTLEGDLIGKVVIKPGYKFMFRYAKPGIYGFRIENVQSIIHIKPHDYENPPSWYDKDSTGFTEEYLDYNKIFETGGV